MKKNRMMRLASILLVCVLLSTSVISGTFAKYVTTDSASDTARVAKWGVEVTATGSTAFATKYNDAADENGTKVVSSGEAKVVAPGTNGALASISIKGTPEVMVDVDVNATLTLTGWTVDGAVYCPIVFTVGEKTFKIDDTNDTIEKLTAAVAAEFNAMDKTNVAANTDLAADIAISWAWAFEGDNAKDTELGNLETAPTISFSCDVTVTQVN